MVVLRRSASRRTRHCEVAEDEHPKAPRVFKWTQFLWLVLTGVGTIMLVPCLLSPAWVVYNPAADTRISVVPEFKEIGVFYCSGYESRSSVTGATFKLGHNVPKPYFEISGYMILAALVLSSLSHMVSIAGLCTTLPPGLVRWGMYLPHILAVITLVGGLAALPAQFKDEPFIGMCKEQPVSNVTKAFRPCESVRFGMAYYIAAGVAGFELLVMVTFACVSGMARTRT